MASPSKRAAAARRGSLWPIWCDRGAGCRGDGGGRTARVAPPARPPPRRRPVSRRAPRTATPLSLRKDRICDTHLLQDVFRPGRARGGTPPQPPPPKPAAPSLPLRAAASPPPSAEAAGLVPGRTTAVFIAEWCVSVWGRHAVAQHVSGRGSLDARMIDGTVRPQASLLPRSPRPPFPYRGPAPRRAGRGAAQATSAHRRSTPFFRSLPLKSTPPSFALCLSLPSAYDLPYRRWRSR